MRTSAKKNHSISFKIFYEPLLMVFCLWVDGYTAFRIPAQNFKSVLTLWDEDVQMTVYLSPDLSRINGRFFIIEKT